MFFAKKRKFFQTAHLMTKGCLQRLRKDCLPHRAKCFSWREYTKCTRNFLFFHAAAQVLHCEVTMICLLLERQDTLGEGFDVFVSSSYSFHKKDHEGCERVHVCDSNPRLVSFHDSFIRSTKELLAFLDASVHVLETWIMTRFNSLTSMFNKMDYFPTVSNFSVFASGLSEPTFSPLLRIMNCHFIGRIPFPSSRRLASLCS